MRTFLKLLALLVAALVTIACLREPARYGPRMPDAPVTLEGWYTLHEMFAVDWGRWNALEPNQESRFEDYYLNPRLSLALELVFGNLAKDEDLSRYIL